jgi:hypothetical protein
VDLQNFSPLFKLLIAASMSYRMCVSLWRHCVYLGNFWMRSKPYFFRYLLFLVFRSLLLLLTVRLFMFHSRPFFRSLFSLHLLSKFWFCFFFSSVSVSHFLFNFLLFNLTLAFYVLHLPLTLFFSYFCFCFCCSATVVFFLCFLPSLLIFIFF